MVYEICKECGRFFEKTGRVLCDTCYDKDQEAYKLVKEFVLNNKGATTIDVINATGASLRTIRRYIKDGRLEYGAEVMRDDLAIRIEGKS